MNQQSSSSLWPITAVRVLSSYFPSILPLMGEGMCVCETKPSVTVPELVGLTILENGFHLYRIGDWEVEISGLAQKIQRSFNHNW